MKRRVALRWFGGKSKYASWIINHFPKHTNYVEVFGGAASVLFSKPRSEGIEVYNDKNDQLVNFFRVLRDAPQKLREQLKFMPYSRSLFEIIHERQKTLRPNESNSVECAANFYFLNRTSFSGLAHTFSASTSCRSNAFSYYNAMPYLEQFSERLRYVVIENKSFEELITYYDRPDTLFYIDPPYLLESTDTNAEYGKEFSFGPEDHERLADMVSKISGKAVISYYPAPLIEKLYPAEKYFFDSLDVVKFASNSNSTSNKRKPATELLIMNYDWREEAVGFSGSLVDFFSTESS